MASDLETRDPYTHGHSRRVARYAGLTAEQMGISGDRLRRIRTAAVIHDIGKIDTPIDVLCKPAALTADEFELIKRHPIDGERLVRILEDEEISSIVRSHHERLDGSGYPDAIFGEQIPLGARIVAVVDTFDAITSTRPYRSARTHKQALDIIQADAGDQARRRGGRGVPSRLPRPPADRGVDRGQRARRPGPAVALRRCARLRRAAGWQSAPARLR